MPTKRCRSCLRFGRRKRLDPAPPRLVNTASIERPVFIEINPAGVLRLAAPILYAWSSRAALGRGTTSNDTTAHGQHRRYRLLSRRIPSSRCQSNRQILAWRNPCLFEVWTFGSAAVAVWWSQTGSNRRPPACKAGALPTELWPRLDLATQAGRHLPGVDLRAELEAPATKRMVGLERFELSTSRLSSARSNQLSYRPGKRGRCPNEERETKAAVSRMHSKDRSDS